MLNVYNSPMTKADGDSSTDYERQLNRLDCFFYVKDKTDQPCVYYHKADVNDLGGATVPFYVNDLVLKEIFPKGALCDVFVIANLPGDPTFEAKTPETTMQALGERVLNMADGEYDVIKKPFVMTGSGTVQKGKNSNATATIALARVASKVTMTVKVPKSIEVPKGEGSVTMLPILIDNEGNEPLKTSFRYGTTKSYLSGAYPEDPANFIWTEKIPYTEVDALSDESYYTLTCDVPFYTYARAWEKGSGTAAYVTFEMPWGEDENKDGEPDNYKTYYYQLLVNGKGRNFEPNAWYDMIVTVGVLGSEVEALPKELEELSYFILDWTDESSNGELETGDRDETVEIEKYNYLEVPQTYIEMDNVSTANIRYTASHRIGVKFNTKTKNNIPGYNGSTEKAYFYINNKTNALVDLPNLAITYNSTDKLFKGDNFNDNGNNNLIFNYTLPSTVYSPAYIYITIWLDVNVNGVQDANEMTEDITIVMYPSMYVLRDESTLRSIYVNGERGADITSSNFDSKKVTIGSHNLGSAAGVRNFSGNNATTNYSMFVITVSSFDANDGFKAPALNNAGFFDNMNVPNVNNYEYIIGDPRDTSIDLELDEGGADNITNAWASGPRVVYSATGEKTYVEGQKLTYYYPTGSVGNALQVVAPKFRIVSFNNASTSSVTPYGAAMRCASLQEDGFPAGRWRLPTIAEIQYVIKLQNDDAIEEVFTAGSGTSYGSRYYSSSYSNANKNARVAITINGNDQVKYVRVGPSGYNDGNTTGSVRCVYDEWYWGSERDAKPGAKNNRGEIVGADGQAGTGDDYLFTWGDKMR